MDVSLVIVSYNVREPLRACLASAALAVAESGLQAETIVVDNASTDGSAAMVEAEFGGVTLLRSAVNEGYGAACNRGAGASGGKILVFLNADVELAGGALRELVAALRADAGAGLAGPALVDSAGGPQRSVRRFPSPHGWLLDGTLFERWRATRWLLAGYRPEVEPGRPSRVDWVEGACLAVRGEAFAAIGGFDPGYFMYCEELDLCRRLRRAGRSVLYVPAAVVTHQGGASAGQAAAINRARFLRSKVRYADRTWSRAMAVVAATFYASALGLELALELIKALVPAGDRGGRIRAARAIARSLWLFAIGGTRRD
jgi:GT2 family glycosyltransferase